MLKKKTLQKQINCYFKLSAFPIYMNNFKSLFCNVLSYNIPKCNISWCLNQAAHVMKWLRFQGNKHVSVLSAKPAHCVPLPAHLIYIKPESGSDSQSCCCAKTLPSSLFVSSGSLTSGTTQQFFTD